MIIKTEHAKDKISWLRITVIILLAVLAVLFPILVSYAEDQQDFVFSQTEDSIFKTLIDNGYSTAGACGILGNISVENPEFEPDLTANGGITYGLFQWSDIGGRRSFLKRWCNNRLLYPNRVEGQIAYALYELNGGDDQASRVNDYLKTAVDPQLAAMEFAVGFERCIGSTADTEADGIYTGEVYPERYGETYQALSKRMANAQTYYDSYSTSSLSPELNLDIDGTPTAGIIAEQEDKMEEELEKEIPVIDVTSSGILWMFRILSLLVGYLLGCVVGAAVIVRNIRDKKRLKMDEKLPSLFMMLKHLGVKETILAAIIDILKFYLALGLVYLVTRGALGSEQILWTGIGVILGNDYPFWHKFRGSMGIMVTTVFLCTYMPIWGFECCLLGLLVAVISKSLPFGALCISLFAVPYGFLCKGPEAGIFITIALILLMIRHYRFLKAFISRDLLKKHYGRHLKRA